MKILKIIVIVFVIIGMTACSSKEHNINSVRNASDSNEYFQVPDDYTQFIVRHSDGSVWYYDFKGGVSEPWHKLLVFPPTMPVPYKEGLLEDK